MDFSDGSCSRTRSGLVRRKSFMVSKDDSCSRTRSGLVRRRSFTDSSGSSCSRTRSGLVRRKGFMDSSDGSCSRTRSGLVRESPSVKAQIMDGPVRKGLPDVDGHLIEETPSRTRSGLVRQSPIVKREDMPVAPRNGFVRGNPDIKTLREDGPVIKGLADGWLKEDRPLGTRSGLVRESLTVKALTMVESATKGHHDGCSKEDTPVETQSCIVRGSNTAKTRGKDESVTEGLPDGWRKVYRPRKPGSSQKNDPYYIDPVSGYEFRSLKDVNRYLQTGDIRQCATRPKKGTLYDVCITENQTHTSSSSQQTRPGTADKAIQCEILTSEGIMLPLEELFTPHRGKNTEHTTSLEPESMKPMEGYGQKLQVLQRNGVQPFLAQCAPRQTESIKRKNQDVKVKSKKRRSEASSAVTPFRGVLHCLAALNAQSESSIEPEDQPVSINLVNQLQTVEANNNDLSEMSQSSTMNKIHCNEGITFNQLWSRQEVTVNRMQAMQENITNHLQPSQVDPVNRVQMNQENTGHQLQLSLANNDIPMRTVHGYATDQPSQAETMNHKQTNMENTFNQLESVLAGTLNHIEANQENTAPELQSSIVDRVIPAQTMQEYTTPSQEDTMDHIQMNLENTNDHSRANIADPRNRRQANQRNTSDELQFQADTVTKIQMMQNNKTNLPQPSQANSLSQIHINMENTNDHLDYAENPLLQTGFSWAPEQNGGTLVTDFWRSVENQDSSVPMQIDGVAVASFPANVKFQNAAAAAAAESVVPTTQATIPVTASDQSGLVIPSLFGNAWSDPCLEFAFKTLTGDIPVLDDTAAVTDYFPQQQDLNKGTTSNSSSSALDNSRTHTQIDVNLPLPRPSDKLYNGSWFPPES